MLDDFPEKQALLFINFVLAMDCKNGSLKYDIFNVWVVFKVRSCNARSDLKLRVLASLGLRGWTCLTL